MGFITRCCKNAWLKAVRLGLWLGVLWATVAQAQVGSVEFTQFKLEKNADQVLLSSSVQFDLPTSLEEALLKGVPLFFVAEVDINRERWYWFDKKINNVARHMRLFYQPLTRRWRLALHNGPIAALSQPGTFNQNFESLADALAAIKRVSNWPVADLHDIDPSASYRLQYRFYLDLSQLPRPLQIGAVGQSDWNLSASLTQKIGPDSLK